MKKPSSILYKRPGVYKSTLYSRYGLNRGGIGVYKLPYASQEFEEDENVNTSLGHKIPLDRAGFSVSLDRLRELAPMQLPEDACGFKVSLNYLRELAPMQLPEDACGFEVSLISLTELT